MVDENQESNAQIVPYLRKKPPPASYSKKTDDTIKTKNYNESTKKILKPEQQNNSASSSIPSDTSSELLKQNYESIAGSNGDFTIKKKSSSKPNSRQRSNLVSRDSNISNFSDLIELDPSIFRPDERLTPILDEIDVKDVKKIKKQDGKKSTAKSVNEKKSRYSTIRNGAQTGADVNKNENKHESYAEQYYHQNTYLSSWREKFREQAKEFGPNYGRVNSPVEREEGYSRSTARAKFLRKQNYEDMHFFNPITEALVRPYYGNIAIEHSDDFFTHNKLLEKWKEEKKEFLAQQKEPTIHEMLYALRDKPESSKFVF
jgi:hypothetical protein